jgi:hypothetical protein
MYQTMILVAPNNSRINGTIRSMKRNSSISVELEVNDSADVEGLPNFTKRHVGSIITVTFKRESEANLKVGTLIQCLVEFIGDERGGTFHGKLI